MKLNKEEFLTTEFGSSLKETIIALDFWLCEKDMTSQWLEAEKYSVLRKDIDKLFAQWRVYQLALKQFYGVEYNFSRTNDYFGLCTADETDWLFQVHKKSDPEPYRGYDCETGRQPDCDFDYDGI